MRATWEEDRPQRPRWRPPQRPELTSPEHAAWRELIRGRCGLDFVESRERYLSRCLWQRARTLGLGSYRDYYRHMAAGEEDEEWQALVELLVNCESSFFRHRSSFDALREVLGEILARKAARRDFCLGLWSAGCAAGQEAYSMAICAQEAVAARPATWQIKVIGSDISQEALAKARRGRYLASELRSFPESIRKRYLDPVDPKTSDGGSPRYEAHARLRGMVQFGAWNLMRPSTWWVTGQDVIFCQNLLIYLQEEDRLALVERLCRRLNPGGYLFLAPGEVVGLRLPRMRAARLEDCLAYQRTS